MKDKRAVLAKATTWAECDAASRNHVFAVLLTEAHAKSLTALQRQALLLAVAVLHDLELAKEGKRR